MPGSWKPLNNPQPANIDVMLLLTDGAVMCHEYLSANWYKLSPDKDSDYANGTWEPLSPLPNNAPLGQNGPTNAPLYFASAVLRDGTVFCAGGEDNGAYNDVDLLAASIYDPVNDIWTPIPTPPSWTNIGDGPSCVLPDGRLLLGCANTNPDANATAIWNPETGAWSAGGDGLDEDSEEGWTLLPDGTVLAVQCTSIPNAQKYIIATNEWVSAGDTLPAILPGNAAPGDVAEMGPQILLPDGRVFAIGATGQTALYTPPNTTPTDPGSWGPGPTFPLSGGAPMGAVDAPGALLPNGNVLCVVGPTGTPGQADPTFFFEFDPATLSLTPAPAPAIAGTSPTYNARLLVLPTGQVMYSAYDGAAAYDIQIYTPAGGPKSSWRPQITHVPRHLRPGRTYRLHGRQLNGLSQACTYGDDQQMATNYPLVRLWGHPSVGAVYCRTFDHSTMGVATGKTIHHTHFHLPDHLPHGEYRLVVIANGIASHPIDVHVARHFHDHDHDGEHDEEIAIVDQDPKYKDKDAKEAKEKEKDVKDVKEKETKECKEKECKEVEQKHCKEKEHKEFEQKSWKEKEYKEHKEKDCPEQAYCPPHEKRRDQDEMLDRIEHILRRLDHIEDETRRRPFIREDERPHVGERAMRARHHDDDDSRTVEPHSDHEEHRQRESEPHRHDEEARRAEEERLRHEAERRTAPEARTRREPPPKSGPAPRKR